MVAAHGYYYNCYCLSSTAHFGCKHNLSNTSALSGFMLFDMVLTLQYKV